MQKDSLKLRVGGVFHICIAKPHTHFFPLLQFSSVSNFSFIAFWPMVWSFIHALSRPIQNTKEFRSAPTQTVHDQHISFHFISVFLPIYSRRTNEISTKEITPCSYLPRSAYFAFVFFFFVFLSFSFFLPSFRQMFVFLHRIPHNGRRMKQSRTKILINHSDSYGCRQQSI